MNLTDTAVDSFIVYELLALRSAEQKLRDALSKAGAAALDDTVRAITALRDRAAELEFVLDSLETEPSAVAA